MNKTYRCSACGRLTHDVQFRGDTERSAMACPLHPEAEVIEWTMRMQSRLTYLTGSHRAGKTIDELRAECEGDRGMTSAFVLFERWGGEFPERQTTTTGPATPAGLFG